MAGIAGIILKTKEAVTSQYKAGFQKMMEKLAISESQVTCSHFGAGFCFGYVQPIHEKQDNRLQIVKALDLHCLIDGLVFINDDERKLVCSHFELSSSTSTHELIPYLFEFYKEKIVNHITGWFNLCFIRENSGETFIVNDRFGYLPLYYYDSGKIFIFASKIECLVNSGLLGDIQPDLATFAEHLYFNYPLSDFTYIRNIRTVPNATGINFKGNDAVMNKYWGVSELFGGPKAGEKDSLELINEGLKNSIRKLFSATSGPINLSLTGGWDSRLILSYLLPDYRDRLNLYHSVQPVHLTS